MMKTANSLTSGLSLSQVAGGFVASDPVRALDTVFAAGPIPGWGLLDVKVAGVGGVPGVGVDGVAVTVTAINAAVDGVVTGPFPSFLLRKEGLVAPRWVAGTFFGATTASRWSLYGALYGC